MANTLFQWLIGKDVTITMTPQVVAANGDLSDHALGALSFKSRWEDFDGPAVSYTSENLSPADTPFENEVPYEISSMIMISELMTAAKLGTNPYMTSQCERALRASIYQKVLITYYDHTEPTPGSIGTATSYVVLRSWDPNYRKNKSVGRGVFKGVAVASAPGVYINNPAYA